MTVESSASATWEGDLASGQGTVRPASGAFPELSLTWHRRAESRETGTSPEELIAAAHASCFAMALSHGLATAGFPPRHLDTSARVTFGMPAGISAIHLTVKGKCSRHRRCGLLGGRRRCEGELPRLQGARSRSHHSRGDPRAVTTGCADPLAAVCRFAGDGIPIACGWYASLRQPTGERDHACAG